MTREIETGKRWYMITTISGKEEKVIESLKNRVVSEGLEQDIEDFKAMFVPTLTAKEYEKKMNGDDFKIKMKNIYPGYIFIKMNMTNEAWFIVRNTQYVTGLVGSSGQRTKPTPISNIEMRKMDKLVEKMTADFEAGKIASTFAIGDVLEVQDGPSKGLAGPVIELNDEKQMATIELILFERRTPVSVEYKNLKIK